MMLGEVAPGGVGSGLYGMLVLAVVAVFVAGLMVGRTPEYLGKKLGRREMTLASLLPADHPGHRAGRGRRSPSRCPRAGRDAQQRPARVERGALRLTSAGNNNGSAFAASSANTPFYNTALGLAMVLGRFVPIVLVVALAGKLAAQGKVPVTSGTLPTHRPLFAGCCSPPSSSWSSGSLLPVLALGPLAEGLS